MITVKTHDDNWFLLLVSSESGLDEVFYQQLRALWQKQRKGTGSRTSDEGDSGEAR